MPGDAKPYDEKYWGTDGIDLSRWGYECRRGLQYKDVGAPAKAGTPGQVRKISSGRKARGMASDGHQEAKA